MTSIGDKLFHQTNYIEMYQGIVKGSCVFTKRFAIVEIPFESKYSLGIILPQKSESVDYLPNNIPKMMCGELKTLVKRLEPYTIKLTMPLFTQERNNNKLVLRSGRIKCDTKHDVTVNVMRVFLFYVRDLDENKFLLVGDYQGE